MQNKLIALAEGVIALAVAICLQGAARADGPSGPDKSIQFELSEEELLEVLRGMVSRGLIDDAEQLINRARSDVDDEPSLIFLEALIAEIRGDAGTARRKYREILEQRPDLVRVRLAMAMNLFQAGKDRAARYHFELALAGDLPDALRRSIKAHLQTIRRRQTWQIDVGVSLVSNSNVNGGPDLTSVDMFGLPFELSDEARQAAGMGVVASVAGRRVAGNIAGGKFRTDASIRISEHFNSDGDDLSVYASVGPQWNNPGEIIWLAATGSRRWFRGDGFQTSRGALARLEKHLPSNRGLRAELRYRSVDYDNRTYDDGNEFSVSFSLSQALDAQSRGRLALRTARHHAHEDPWSWSQIGLGLFWQRELSSAISVELNSDLELRTFDDRHPAFLKKRRDLVSSVSASATKRDWRLSGFVPMVSYQYLNVASSIDFYDFDRHWVNFGLTRSF